MADGRSGLAVAVTAAPAVPLETLSVWMPDTVPNFQLPTLATPPVVEALPAMTEPLPGVAVNITTVPFATILPNWSFTVTEGAMGSVVLTVAFWLLPAVTVIDCGASGIPVAVNVTTGSAP